MTSLGKLYINIVRSKLSASSICLKPSFIVLSIISFRFDLFESSFEKIKKYNRQLNVSTKRPDDLDAIIKEYEKKGYEAIENEFKKKNKHFRFQIIKNKIKILLKRM